MTEPLSWRNGVGIVVSVAVLVAVQNASANVFRETQQNQAANWSEWQDLNLRPPRPERGDNARYPPIATVQGSSPICREVPLATDAPQQTASLFDYFVGTLLHKQRRTSASGFTRRLYRRENASQDH